MLEKLLSQMRVDEKKDILTDKYGMIMTAELERRIQTMCNLLENIEARGIEKGIAKGIEKGVEEGITRERFNAIERMLKAGATKEQIVLYGYTEDEFAEAEKALLVNACG